MAFLVIEKAVRGHCRRCPSPMATRGYRVRDAAGVEQTLCLGHLAALLVGCCLPEGTPRLAAGDRPSPVEEEVGVAS
jgi:hypothetical protein